MGAYDRLCVSRSIGSASILQQLRDPSVILLIVTPAGLRASARAGQSWEVGGNGGGVGDRRTGGRRGEQNSISRNGHGETDGTRVSVGLCARTAKLVSPSLLYLRVRPCPLMQSHTSSQITSVAYTPKQANCLYTAVVVFGHMAQRLC